MHVLLDLYGVLLDHEKMFRGYRERLAELLSARIGRTPGVRGHGRQRDERRSAPWRRPVRPDRRDLHGPFAERAERTVPVLARDSASTRSPAPGLCPRR